MILNIVWVWAAMMMNNSIVTDFKGDIKLIEMPLTAFLCSSKYSATAVLKSYDWAILQRKLGKCVISGFHSIIEKDVLDLLLEGSQPVILALARGMTKCINQKLQRHIDDGRLLVVSFFSSDVTHITKETAIRRNEIIISLSNEIVIAHASKGGKLEEMVKGIMDKNIKFL